MNFFNGLSIMSGVNSTMHSAPYGLQSWSIQRSPTDRLYISDLLLQNIVVGSRYLVLREDNGEVLASGVASSTDVLISGLPAYSDLMLVEIRVRLSSSIPSYLPLTTYARLSRGGVIAYISQTLDAVING